MAENSSGLESKIGAFVLESLPKDAWVSLDPRLSVESIDKLEAGQIQNYDVLLLIGCGDGTSLPKVPKNLEAPLWRFVENGGLLYGEMLDTSEYTTSRLFGFKQDFSIAQEYLKKLKLNVPCGNLPIGTLLQWDGQFIPGFAIDSSSILTKGEFRQTHFAPEGEGLPALTKRDLGRGVVYYSTFPLLTSKTQWMYRPYLGWASLIASLQNAGLPLIAEAPPIRIMENNQSKSGLEAGFGWFVNSGILPRIDGAGGVYENVHSHHGGLTKDFRPDCHAQSALAFYLYGKYTGDPKWLGLSFGLLDFIIKEGMQDEDETSCSYGFWKWFDYPGAYPHQIFTDDNSWVATVLLYIGRQENNEEYLRRGLLTAKALLKTQRANGLRPEQIVREGPKREVSFNPHFESICHVAFLQAYLVSGDESFLQTALRGMTTLKDNKDKWKWMYSRTAALARYLFPLSLVLQIVKKQDTWLAEFNWTISELKSFQHNLGAIEEAENPDPKRFGQEDTGVFINDGEGIADLLYTNNFLLLNLWEGWKGSGDPEVLKFYQELRGFILKVQITSDFTKFDGAWMRAFDLNQGEYYGNLGDTGWGPYCIESGWTQGIILSGLLLGELDASLVD